MSLSANAIRYLHNSPKIIDFQPIVQILDMKLLSSQRYQLVISDGEFYQQALLGSQCNTTMGSGLIQAFHLIKILDYVLNTVANTKVLFITDLEHASDYDSQIGMPSRYNEIKASQSKPEQIVEEQTQHKPIPSKLIPKPTEDLYAPIKSLTSHSSSWVIKARVSQKSDKKEWHNARGEGKLFSITLMDAYSDEIQAVFFNAAVDTFYDVFKDGKVYTFSNGIVRSAKRKFQAVENDYQLSFDINSIITEVPDDGVIGYLKFNFVPLDQLAKIDLGTILDVCGIITEISPLTDLVSKKGDSLTKRNVKISDHTFHSIEITLWNELASLPDLESVTVESKAILAAKSLRLTNFNGLSLTCEKSISSVYINPTDVKELEFMNKWRNAGKSQSLQLTPLTTRTISRIQKELKTIREIKEVWESLMISDQEAIYTIIGYISYIRSDDFSSLTYPACNNGKCKKKVQIELDGFYRCTSCKESFPSCTYRYLLSLAFNDSTESINVNAFDEVGITLFGMTANQLYEISKDQEKFDGIISGVIKKERLGTLRVSINESGFGSRTRYTLLKLEPMNYQQGATIFLDEINYMMSQISS